MRQVTAAAKAPGAERGMVRSGAEGREVSKRWTTPREEAAARRVRRVGEKARATSRCEVGLKWREVEEEVLRLWIAREDEELDEARRDASVLVARQRRELPLGCEEAGGSEPR